MIPQKYSVHVIFKNVFCRKLFTLPELFVVAAILAILISLLIPALKNVSSKGMTLKCMKNQSSIGSALQFFIENNNGNTPKSSMAYDFGNGVSGEWWDQLIDYVEARNDLAWRECPSADVDIYNMVNNTMTAKPWAVRAYGYNYFLSCSNPLFAWDSINKVVNPAKFTMLLCNGHGVSFHGCFSSTGPMKLAETYGFSGTTNTSGASPWHQGMCNYLHLDGHVSSVFSFEWNTSWLSHKREYFHPDQSTNGFSVSGPVPINGW